MGILNECMNRDIQVWTIKDNYRLGSDINSKVLAFAFGLSAEIERNLISQRTKEALARKKAEGVILGRPKGRKSAKTKLTGQEKKIQELLDKKAVEFNAIWGLYQEKRKEHFDNISRQQEENYENQHEGDAEHQMTLVRIHVYGPEPPLVIRSITYPKSV